MIQDDYTAPQGMQTDTSMYLFMKEGCSDASQEKIYYFNNRITAGELLRDIEKIAAYLRGIGIRQGDSVGICLPNIPQAVVALYAINSIGAVANIIHPKVNGQGLKSILINTSTTAIFVLDCVDYIDMLCNMDVRTISCSPSDYMKGVLKTVVNITRPNVNARAIAFPCALAIGEKLMIGPFPCGDEETDDPGGRPAVYLHSSGTTADAKTVVLSNKAFNCLVKNVITSTSKNHRYEPCHTMLMVLPLFHGFGLGICIHLSLRMFKVAMLPRFAAKKAIAMIRKHNIQYIAAIPGMLEKMLKEKSVEKKALGSLKLVFCGADRLRPEVKTAFDNLMLENGSDAEVFEGYGLSEVASVLTVNVKGDSKAGTLGKPIANTEIMIIDDDGNPCPAGVVGRVLIRSESMMTGYLNNGGEDSGCYYTDKDGKKWLVTGDLGSLDADGFFRFAEREKRMIKIGGVNIFPGEVETLVKSLREIDDACVVRKVQDGKPCTILYVVLNEKYRFSLLIEQMIEQLIKEQCMKYAVPKEIIQVDSLKKNGLGKADYRYYEELEK